MKERLNKIIAKSGICSRRKADQLIEDGRVKLNGRPVNKLGILVDPKKDKISVNGRVLSSTSFEKKIYILLNKPRGFVTTTRDIHAKKTVMDLLPKLNTRIYPVGRLDKETSGLLLLTNDGELSYKLTHPKFGIDRIYKVQVMGILGKNTIKKIEAGNIPIDDYLTSSCKINIISQYKNKTELKLTLQEGRKREIRKIFAYFKHPVKKLHRIGFGKLTIENIRPGKWQYIKKSAIF